MDTEALLSSLEDLEDNIDDLEESLQPLLAAAISVTTKKLPLLDRAKLYTVLVYSIESLLFSYLRLNGVQAKTHAVFRELTRVKQYFQKIKQAEDGQNPTRPAMSLNKQATGRFIKQALAGNDRFDAERAEREARERLLAARKSRTIRSAAPESVSQVETSASSEQNEEMEDGEVEEEDCEMVDTPIKQPSNGKRKSKKEKGSKKLPRIRMNGDKLLKPKKEKVHKSRRADRKRGFQGHVDQELAKPG